MSFNIVTSQIPMERIGQFTMDYFERIEVETGTGITSKSLILTLHVLQNKEYSKD